MVMMIRCQLLSVAYNVFVKTLLTVLYFLPLHLDGKYEKMFQFVLMSA